MLTVHHLEYSQSFRIVWLLEELKVVDYDLKLYQRNKDNSAPKELQDVSPLGTAPVITDDDLEDGSTVVLCESNAIIDYILDKANANARAFDASQETKKMVVSSSSTIKQTNFIDDTQTHMKYLFWYHSVQGTFQPLIQVDSLFRIMQTKVPFPLSAIVKMLYKKLQANYLLPRLNNYLTLLETQLGTTNQTSVVVGSDDGDDKNNGAITAADITLIYPMDVIFTRYSDHDFASKYPNCMRWLNEMRSRPAFRRAQEKVHENNDNSGGRISKDL